MTLTYKLFGLVKKATDLPSIHRISEEFIRLNKILSSLVNVSEISSNPNKN